MKRAVRSDAWQDSRGLLAKRRVELAQLRPDPDAWRARTGSWGDLAALGRSMREVGQIEPLICSEAEADHYEVHIGARRLQALRIGEPPFDGYVAIEVYPRELAVRRAVESRCLDRTLCMWQRMRTVAEADRAWSLPANVDRLRTTFDAIGPSARKQLDNGLGLSLGELYELAELSHGDQDAALVRWIQTGSVSPPAPRARRASRPLRSAREISRKLAEVKAERGAVARGWQAALQWALIQEDEP